ncbi:Chemotaxis response regulator protein-glutamate methylesterase [bioreactor metagenome]|jgi:Response regulator containing CheY-like receiver, AAA-type ATPase, and DNA-binding domains|uniref:Chemotaxis response regulator protein-glutamate methylesterase n=1 Tax=bioreactor metagenome TaxID=1076179 RepID=A0A644UBQ1_9ZZZZ|nr:response regulator [Acidaminococcaceae bacterium]
MNKKIRIMAVDDEPDILYTLKAIGTAVGWDVYTESNSIAAVDEVEKIKPDIILMDYHMPQQSGVLTVKKIREIDNKVPIIVLTIDDGQELANEFLEVGASDFATKPIKVPDLVARINVHLKLVEKEMEVERKNIVNKCINAATLEIIYAYCRSTTDWFYLEDIVQSVGLAYQTTSRYVQYLVGRGELQVLNNYGKVGRPRNKYRYDKEAIEK